MTTLGIRSIINFYAFTHSITKTVQYEVLQRQIEILSSINTAAAINNCFDFDATLLLEKTTPLIIVTCLTWYSLKYTNNDENRKLEKIQDYRQTRNMIRSSLLIFVLIFCRNVENAI